MICNDKRARDHTMDLDDQVVSKYKVAADIANIALQGVANQVNHRFYKVSQYRIFTSKHLLNRCCCQCVPGKDVSELCAFGNTVVVQRCAAVFKNKNVDKGVAFPTSISVNSCVCHFSPFPPDSFLLKCGDVVKIDLGCHIDGFIAVVAHTLIVPGIPKNITPALSDDSAKNVVCAAYTGALVASKVIHNAMPVLSHLK